MRGKFGAEGIRAIWVTRWDYRSARDIAVIMENCRRAGFNTVLFQVRGNGTAFYRSKVEPWADELGGRDPGFDPLAVACREAHRRGLAIHAWVNVAPGWRGKAPPQNRRQLYHARAEWFWRDESGRREPLGWYSNLNLCWPEVRAYLAAVMHEIVARYPVEGLHMDYIRFPNEWNAAYPAGARVPDYPRDPRTLGLFRQASHRTPDQAPAQWDAWRTQQVDETVREISRAVRKARPGVALTAAVGADPAVAKKKHFQDAPRWMASGWIDGVFPMNYEADLGSFDERLGRWTSGRSRGLVVTGVMLDKRAPALIVQQLEHARRGGRHFCAFAYNALFERLDDSGRPIRDADSGTRAARREAVFRYMRRIAAPAR
jgi:uncharacterized lipoprotein YddW (UPF0748 family)